MNYLLTFEISSTALVDDSLRAFSFLCKMILLTISKQFHFTQRNKQTWRLKINELGIILFKGNGAESISTPLKSLCRYLQIQN